MEFSKYKKTVIACILALGIGVGGGYYFLAVLLAHSKQLLENKQNKLNQLLKLVIPM